MINSLHLQPESLEDHNIHLHQKYEAMHQNEPRFETFKLDGADIVLTAYGTTSRIARSTIARLEKEGVQVGLIRPITLFPFPEKAYQDLPGSVRAILVVKMSMGQIIDDVRMANEGRLPVHFVGRPVGLRRSKVRDILQGVSA